MELVMDISEVIQFITLAAVVISAIVNIAAMVSKAASKAAANAKTEVMLQNIYTKVENIEKKQFTIETTLQAHGERITAAEQSVKSAHHRIDDITGKKGDRSV